jgi:hypothetical protein
MNRRAIVVAGVIALVAVSGGALGGYAIGRSSAPSDADAARARDEARRAAAKDVGRVVDEQLEQAREEGVEKGRRSGQKAGATRGRAAGQAETAERGAGPTPLPPPKLPTDLAVPGGAKGFVSRPSSIVIGNHEVLEGIVWQTWGGDTATATAQLVGVECDPSCAEGPETRDSVRVTASNPNFNPDDVRYYSDLVVDGHPSGRIKLEIQPF